MILQVCLVLPSVFINFRTTFVKLAIYADKMSRCISWVWELCIFRLTERNNIWAFQAESQKRCNFRILRAAFAYFQGKTRIVAHIVELQRICIAVLRDHERNIEEYAIMQVPVRVVVNQYGTCCW